MKKTLLWMLFASLLWSCSSAPDYNPETYLSSKEQSEVLLKILPYVAKLPMRFQGEKRFSAELDSFYRQEVKKYRMQHYYISPEDSFHYFMINRPAPSLYEKRTAIAGRFKKTKDGKIINYEESFWTFKMKLDELDKKGAVLFAHYAEGKDIKEYMPGKQKDEWIEFPDDKCYYDKNEKAWKVSGEIITADSLNQL